MTGNHIISSADLAGLCADSPTDRLVGFADSWSLRGGLVIGRPRR